MRLLHPISLMAQDRRARLGVRYAPRCRKSDLRTKRDVPVASHDDWSLRSPAGKGKRTGYVNERMLRNQKGNRQQSPKQPAFTAVEAISEGKGLASPIKS